MRIRTSDNKEQQIEELTYGKEYKENNAKRISRHNIERVNYQVGKPFHDGTIACFDTDDERNITSTGIYHDELFDKDFIGIGFN